LIVSMTLFDVGHKIQFKHTVQHINSEQMTVRETTDEETHTITNHK